MGDFVHYPNEKWFPIAEDNTLPEGILDERLYEFYDADKELVASDLIDLQSGNPSDLRPAVRSVSLICKLHIPMKHHRRNLYVSNGCRPVTLPTRWHVCRVFQKSSSVTLKNRIIAESISLPEIADVLARYPGVVEAIAKLEEEGFPILSMTPHWAGNYPVICVVLFNPANGTCFASFGAHPDASAWHLNVP